MNFILDMHMHGMQWMLSMMTLKEYLSKTTMTDAEFGVKIGVSQSQVSRIKNEISRPSLEVAVAIEKVTNGVVLAKSFVMKSEDAA